MQTQIIVGEHEVPQSQKSSQYESTSITLDSHVYEGLGNEAKDSEYINCAAQTSNEYETTTVDSGEHVYVTVEENRSESYENITS